MARAGRKRHFTKVALPSIATPGLGSLGGAPRVRRDRITAASQTVLPPESAEFSRRHPIAPRTEWAVYWVLTAVLKWREGYLYDFVTQVAIPAVGLSAFKGFRRADFWILPHGRGGSPGGQYSRGLILNPISTFTHPSRSKDALERQVLAKAGYLEIFLDEQPLLSNPIHVVQMALRGVDISAHR